MAATEFDGDDLRKWYQEYITQDADSLNLQSPSITFVNSDHIDPSYVEDQIDRALTTTRVSGGCCERCRELFRQWPNLGTKAWAHAVGTSFYTKDIEAAHRLGCKSCSFFLTRLKKIGWLDTIRKVEKRLDRLDVSAPTALSIENWASDETQLMWFNLPGKVATHCNSSCAQQCKFQADLVFPSAAREDNRDSFDIARDWLRVCTEDHSSCSNEDQLEWPTRLVCVANNAVKLVATASLEKLPRYATLSYCWGTDDYTKSTFNSSISSHDGVVYDDLPKTFRDVIEIVRKIDLEYVWIDALCITQTADNNEDWLRESGQMRYVYGGAHVNIAASTATNVHAGCLSKSPDFSGGFSTRLETDERCEVRIFSTGEVYEESTIDNHLATRAWALQEKLLAPRTIYWGDQGLFWECSALIASEFIPDGLVDRFRHRLARSLEEGWDWFDIVRNYSKGNLTRPSDKLTALSGIARRQYETVSDDYFAGMWRTNFIKQLGWKSVSKTKKPEEWRAPSWSWTSVDEEVHYFPYWNHDGVAKDTYAQLLHVSTSLAGPDPFGPINGAELRLSCSAMVRGRYGKGENVKDSGSDPRQDDAVTLGKEGLRYPVSLDHFNDDLAADGTVYLLPLFGGESGFSTTRPRVREDTDDEQANMNDGNDSSSDENDEDMMTGHMVRGLILRRHGPAKGNFVRIGWFDFRDLDFTDPDSPPNRLELTEEQFKKFLLIMEEEGSSTAEEICTERLSDAEVQERRYVITID